MKLAIVSHTEHYKDPNNIIVGWGPTVTEINHLTEIFDEIFHVAMLHGGLAPQSALPYTSNKIKFIPLPPLGGPKLRDKLQLLFKAPKVFGIINKVLKEVDCFQFRAPTGIGVYAIPYLVWISNSKGWFKYAGNWNQSHPPIGYAFQRWILNHQSSPVTINGNWPNQKKNFISFENPCLTNAQLTEGKYYLRQKDFNSRLKFCFVGRLESEKGVGRILRALKELDEQESLRIETVHLVGDGVERKIFESLAKESDIEIRFHGFLKREEVFDLYKQCHVFVMPTMASEGFPKVIAEAAAYGCIPLVSSVSAIGQYVKNNVHGKLMKKGSKEEFINALKSLLNEDSMTLKDMSIACSELSNNFTFEYYNNRILNDVLPRII